MTKPLAGGVAFFAPGWRLRIVPAATALFSDRNGQGLKLFGWIVRLSREDFA